jgi:hypothetical protein
MFVVLAIGPVDLFPITPCTNRLEGSGVIQNNSAPKAGTTDAIFGSVKDPLEVVTVTAFVEENVPDSPLNASG